MTIELDANVFSQWANDGDGPVALVVRQALLPVEGADAVVFPPTYAYTDDNKKYNIDCLSDGTKVATLDSIGSQANRMEMMFKEDAALEADAVSLASLVPQVNVKYGDGLSVSLLDAGHRLADALVRSSVRLDDDAFAGEAGQGKDLHERAKEAFLAYQGGDASHIARLAPTSLVFGAWDSRGTQAKLPRIVQSVIRAWGVSPMTRSAQYNPPIDYMADAGAFSQDAIKKAGKIDGPKTKNKFAKAGFLHVPATGQHGGVVVHGVIRRDVTVNLIALRKLQDAGDGNGSNLRRYVLGLSLAVAAEPLDGFLRQGCLLTADPNAPREWSTVSRDGSRQPVSLDRRRTLDLTRQAAQDFFGKGGVPAASTFRFDKKLAEERVQEAAKQQD